jgi:hypothetical protein
MPYRGYRIVVVTPAGRQRYMSLLIPQVVDYVKRGYADEYEVWVNTNVPEDLWFLQEAERQYPDIVRLRFLPEGTKPDGNSTIGLFFNECTRPDTIYVRFDDDIVVLDTPDAFRSLLDFRIDRRDVFLVYGNILNNAITTHVLQRLNIMPSSRGLVGYSCFDENGWKDGKFAAGLHDCIIGALVADGGLQRFRFGQEWRLFHFERVSINCIAWFGDVMNHVCGGIIDDDEEHMLSCVLPWRYNKHNTIFGGFCCVHYAFYTQRPVLDQAGYDAKYEEALSKVRSQAST